MYNFLCLGNTVFFIDLGTTESNKSTKKLGVGHRFRLPNTSVFRIIESTTVVSGSLKNLGNNCFLNVILQVAHTILFLLNPYCGVHHVRVSLSGWSSC